MRHESIFYKVLLTFLLWVLTFSVNGSVERVEQKNKAAEWMALSEQAVKTKLGRELRFSERIGLRLAQRQVRRQIQKMNRQANECTRIVLKDGSIIEASWFEMSNHLMEYKDCKTETDVIRTVRMNDVLSIVDVSGNVIYRDGRYLEPEEVKPLQTPWLGILSILIGIAGVIYLFINPIGATTYLLALVGVILGVVGISGNSRNKSKSKEVWTPTIGLIISSIPFLYLMLVAFFGFMLFGMSL